MLYLACAAKSNAAYVAYNEVRAFIAEDGSRPVPVHLRNAPTKLMKQLGYGREYRERLKRTWGIVDGDDCVNAAKYLCQEGLADEQRVIITGGSAGALVSPGSFSSASDSVSCASASSA